MTNTSELVGDVDVCPHCRGTGQPHGIMGGPEHGLCSWCKGTGQKFSSPRNPSETRDSELVREVRFLLDRLNDFEPYLEEGETFRQYAGHVSPSVERLRSLAADTIDRLTSTGEAVPVAWRSEMRLDVFEVDPSEPDGRRWKWKVILSQVPPIEGKGVIFRNITPLYASPREGHVEDAEALRVAREVISDMVRYGLISNVAGTTAYYVGDNVLPTIMGRALPNQGGTKLSVEEADKLPFGLDWPKDDTP